MSDYGKGSRRCPEDWRKVHRNWPLGKLKVDAVIDVCGYATPVRKTKAKVHRYVRKDGGV